MQAQETSIWGLDATGVEDENGWLNVKNHEIESRETIKSIVTGAKTFASGESWILKKGTTNLTNRKGVIFSQISGTGKLYFGDSTASTTGIPIVKNAIYEFNCSDVVNLYIYSTGVAEIRFAEIT
jgi:hypothetical protein